MIKVENAVKVLKCDERKYEDKLYYSLNVMDADGDVYVLSSIKPAAKGATISLQITPSNKKDTKFRPVVGGLL